MQGGDCGERDVGRKLWGKGCREETVGKGCRVGTGGKGMQGGDCGERDVG